MEHLKIFGIKKDAKKKTKFRRNEQNKKRTKNLKSILGFLNEKDISKALKLVMKNHSVFFTLLVMKRLMVET